jgi:hypothetical protein
MYFTLFKVFFIITHLFTTFAAATIDDIGNRDIANIAIPGHGANVAVSADDTADTSKWVLTTAISPYDLMAIDYRGDCTT